MLLACLTYAANTTRFKQLLLQNGRLKIDEYSALASAFESAKYLKILRPPIAVYGDFHGDKKSMLHAVKNEFPKLFLGDYVDRGSNGLFCLQMAVALHLSGEALALRGNHEFLEINKRYGFIEELKRAYPDNQAEALNITARIYAHLKVFQLIHTSKGAVLALHGGIPLSQRLAQIQAFAPDADSVEQMMWGDPGRQYGPSPRGAGIVYDSKHFDDWAARNGVYAVVRGHQFIEGGVEDDFGNGKHYTVFSSSNYVGNRNKAGWLLIDEEGEFDARKVDSEN